MARRYSFTLGADPEMFVKSIAGKGIVPVCGRVGGTKAEPISFPGKGMDGYKYQEDNVALEVNLPPAQSMPAFVGQIERVLALSRNLISPLGLTIDLSRSAHRFSTAELQHPLAQTIGCTPDKCAYSSNDDGPITREPFEISDLANWRYTGGHLHFGYNKELLPEHVFVRLADALVYLPLVAKDRQRGRRAKYGLAGLYRSKPYGIEYRTPSNFWLNDNGYQIASNAFNLQMDLHANTDAINEVYHQIDIDAVKKCIDSGGEGVKELATTIGGYLRSKDLNVGSNFEGYYNNSDKPWLVNE